MNSDQAAFQAFLYAHIPLVKTMEMELTSITEKILLATAPLAPNINDKHTVFGGSSAALQTIAGWSLIKFNLERNDMKNDVVIHQADSQWVRPQSDDMIIKAQCSEVINWQSICADMAITNRPKKISIKTQVFNQQQQTCSNMTGHFVVLKA